MKKDKTKVSFWATKCRESFKDKEAEKIYNKLLKMEGELAKIREKVFDVYTKPRKVVFYKRKSTRKKIK